MGRHATDMRRVRRPGWTDWTAFDHARKIQRRERFGGDFAVRAHRASTGVAWEHPEARCARLRLGFGRRLVPLALALDFGGLLGHPEIGLLQEIPGLTRRRLPCFWCLHAVAALNWELLGVKSVEHPPEVAQSHGGPQSERHTSKRPHQVDFGPVVQGSSRRKLRQVIKGEKHIERRGLSQAGARGTTAFRLKSAPRVRTFEDGRPRATTFLDNPPTSQRRGWPLPLSLGHESGSATWTKLPTLTARSPSTSKGTTRP